MQDTHQLCGTRGTGLGAHLRKCRPQRGTYISSDVLSGTELRSLPRTGWLGRTRSNICGTHHRSNTDFDTCCNPWIRSDHRSEPYRIKFAASSFILVWTRRDATKPSPHGPAHPESWREYPRQVRERCGRLVIIFSQWGEGICDRCTFLGRCAGLIVDTPSSFAAGSGTGSDHRLTMIKACVDAFQSE